MKLNKDQIEMLYRFTRQHYVEFYDLQTELVDHMANDIEEIWKEKPVLTFEQARDLSFKKFGVFGFMDIVDSKKKQLSKKYLRILWSFMKQWFQLPKVILTATLIILVYEIVLLPIAEYVVWSAFILTVFYLLVTLRKLKKELKKKQHKWMLEEMLLIQGNVLAFILATYPIHLINIDFATREGEMALVMSILIVFIGLMIYISVEILPKKSQELLKEHYPEYKSMEKL